MYYTLYKLTEYTADVMGVGLTSFTG